MAGTIKNKRKKRRARYHLLLAGLIGTIVIGAAVCVIGLLGRGGREGSRSSSTLAQGEGQGEQQEEQADPFSPESLLVQYMRYIPEQEYEQMYGMLDAEASGNISREDFIQRNSAIYEGIVVQNMEIQVIGYDREQETVTYQTSFDTVAGNISFENEAVFRKGEKGYQLVWKDSLIFPHLGAADKVRVSATAAKRGEILDRNGRILAGKGVASTVGIVPGKLENREEAISKAAELLGLSPETIEKKLSAQWVKDDLFVPLQTIAKLEDIGQLTLETDEEYLHD